MKAHFSSQVKNYIRQHHPDQDLQKVGGEVVAKVAEHFQVTTAQIRHACQAMFDKSIESAELLGKMGDQNGHHKGQFFGQQQVKGLGGPAQAFLLQQQEVPGKGVLGLNSVKDVEAVATEAALSQTSAIFSAGGNLAAVLNGYGELADITDPAILAQASNAIRNAEQGAVAVGINSVDKAVQSFAAENRGQVEELIERWQVASGKLKQTVMYNGCKDLAQDYAKTLDSIEGQLSGATPEQRKALAEQLLTATAQGEARFGALVGSNISLTQAAFGEGLEAMSKDWAPLKEELESGRLSDKTLAGIRDVNRSFSELVEKRQGSTDGAKVFAELRDINSDFSALCLQEMGSRMQAAEAAGVDVRPEVAKQSLDLATDFRNMLGGYELVSQNPTTDKQALGDKLWNEIERSTQQFGALAQTQAFAELYGKESEQIGRDWDAFAAEAKGQPLDDSMLKTVKEFNTRFLDLVGSKAEGGICKNERQFLNASIESSTEFANLMDGYGPAIMNSEGPARQALLGKLGESLLNMRDEALVLGLITQTDTGVAPSELAMSAYGKDADKFAATRDYWQPLGEAMATGSFTPELLQQVRKSNNENIRLLSERLSQIDQD